MMDAVHKEMLDRLRRVETRLTKFLNAQGFDTGVKRPEWNRSGSVTIPSMACSVQECLAAVPETWDPEEEVIVLHQGQEVMSFYIPGRNTT